MPASLLRQQPASGLSLAALNLEGSLLRCHSSDDGPFARAGRVRSARSTVFARDARARLRLANLRYASEVIATLEAAGHVRRRLSARQSSAQRRPVDISRVGRSSRIAVHGLGVLGRQVGDARRLAGGCPPSAPWRRSVL